MKITEVESKRYMYHVTPKKNLRYITKNGLVPKIGNNSLLYGETDNRIYLFSSLIEAEDAVMNWLGDLYDDEVTLALLKIDVTNIDLGSEVEWEYYTTKLIPPDRIEVISTDF